MSRRTVASDRRPSHKSSSWVRRLRASRIVSLACSAPITGAARQNRSLWNSLFLKSKKASSTRKASTKRGHNNFRTQLETLEERRLLTINVAVVDMAPGGDNSGIVAIKNQLDPANFTVTEFSPAALAAQLAADNALADGAHGTYNVVIFGNDGVNSSATTATPPSRKR